MTTEQVPLAEQTAAVHDEVEKWKEFSSAHPKMTPGERDLAARELEMWRAILASLSDLAAANERIARLEGALRGLYHLGPRPWLPGTSITWPEWAAAYEAADTALFPSGTGSAPNPDDPEKG